MKRVISGIVLIFLASFNAVASHRSIANMSIAGSTLEATLFSAAQEPQQPAAPSDRAKGPASTDRSKEDQTTNSATTKKRALRIGVVEIASTVESSFSTGGLQQELVNDLNFLGAQGVILSSEPEDREAALEQAKQQNCEYVVFTIINGYKTASVGQKLGSVFNRGALGGVGGSGQGRVELNARVKLFQPDGAVPLFDGDVNFRQNDADGTARGLMKTEARNVMLQIKKLESTN